jgi:hypothetical protein
LNWSFLTKISIPHLNKASISRKKFLWGLIAVAVALTVYL